jgi:hypothetical protein
MPKARLCLPLAINMNVAGWKAMIALGQLELAMLHGRSFEAHLGSVAISLSWESACQRKEKKACLDYRVASDLRIKRLEGCLGDFNGQCLRAGSVTTGRQISAAISNSQIICQLPLLHSLPVYLGRPKIDR